MRAGGCRQAFVPTLVPPSLKVVRNPNLLEQAVHGLQADRDMVVDIGVKGCIGQIGAKILRHSKLHIVKIDLLG